MRNNRKRKNVSKTWITKIDDINLEYFFVRDLFQIFRLASKIFVCLRVLIRHSSAIAGDMLSGPFGTGVCCCSGDVVGFRGRPHFRLIAGLSCCAVVTVTPFSLADVPDGSFSCTAATLRLWLLAPFVGPAMHPVGPFSGCPLGLGPRLSGRT